jgi:hypothetical protein
MAAVFHYRQLSELAADVDSSLELSPVALIGCNSGFLGITLPLKVPFALPSPYFSHWATKSMPFPTSKGVEAHEKERHGTKELGKDENVDLRTLGSRENVEPSLLLSAAHFQPPSLGRPYA